MRSAARSAPSSRSSPAVPRSAGSPARAAAADPAPATRLPACRSRPRSSCPNSSSTSSSALKSWLTRWQSVIPTLSSGVSTRPGSGLSITTRKTIPMGSRRSWTSKISSPWLCATRSAASRSRVISSARGNSLPLKHKKWANRPLSENPRDQHPLVYRILLGALAMDGHASASFAPSLPARAAAFRRKASPADRTPAPRRSAHG